MYYLLPALSGIFLGIGFVIPALRYLSLFAILPLFFYLDSDKIPSKRVFFFGLLAGFFYFGLVFIWLFNTWPLDWIGISNPLQGFLLTFSIWLIPVLFSSLFVGFFTYTYQSLKRDCLSGIILAPSLWVALEYLRAFSFSLLIAGKESLLGPHWTMGSLGYLLSQNSNLRGLAEFGGVYLLSFLFVSINAAFYILAGKIRQAIKSRSPKTTMIFGIILVATFLLFVFPIDFHPLVGKGEDAQSSPLKIAVLSTDFPSFFNLTAEEKTKRIEVQKKLLIEEIAKLPDTPRIIVFPEDSRFLASVKKGFLQDNFNQGSVLIIDSARTQTSNGLKSIITFLDIQNGVIGYREKVLLAPLGEYLPYVIERSAKVFNKDWLTRFQKSRGYKTGINTISPVNFSNTKLGVFLCSEIFSATLYRKLGKESQILFNMASLGFAHGSSVLNSQIESIAQIRAVESGRFFIRATNKGLSYIIDNKGNFIAKTPKIGNQIFYGRVYPIKKETLYVKYGDWILIFALIISLASFGIKYYRQKFNPV